METQTIMKSLVLSLIFMSLFGLAVTAVEPKNVVWTPVLLSDEFDGSYLNATENAEKKESSVEYDEAVKKFLEAKESENTESKKKDLECNKKTKCLKKQHLQLQKKNLELLKSCGELKEEGNDVQQLREIAAIQYLYELEETQFQTGDHAKLLADIGAFLKSIPEKQKGKANPQVQKLQKRYTTLKKEEQKKNNKKRSEDDELLDYCNKNSMKVCGFANSAMDLTKDQKSANKYLNTKELRPLEGIAFKFFPRENEKYFMRIVNTERKNKEDKVSIEGRTLAPANEIQITATLKKPTGFQKFKSLFTTIPVQYEVTVQGFDFEDAKSKSIGSETYVTENVSFKMKAEVVSKTKAAEPAKDQEKVIEQSKDQKKENSKSNPEKKDEESEKVKQAEEDKSVNIAKIEEKQEIPDTTNPRKYQFVLTKEIA